MHNKEMIQMLEEIKLRNRQRYINKMFEEEGLTNKVLNEQIKINKKRNELDLTDKSEVIHKDYVQ